jgi:hypothetical protein
MLKPLRTYQIPESRLPFVNTEIAKIDLPSGRHLVSSSWGGTTGGRLYFWNPQSQQQMMRPLPGSLPGAYMLKTASDGRLYIGAGNGDLQRYDPAQDSFKTLVTGELRSITWGGCIIGRFVIWSTSPGDAAVYDWQREELVNVFRPLDQELPNALYAHRGVPTPDGKVLLVVNVPQARLVVLDPETQQRHSYTPKSIHGRSYLRDPVFLDEQTVSVFVGGGHDPGRQELQMFQYPNWTLLARVPNPPPATGDMDCKACRIGDHLYAHARESGILYRLHRHLLQWTAVAQWSKPEALVVCPWDEHHLAGLTIGGEAILYNLKRGERQAMWLDSSAPLPVHAMCVVPDRDLLVGAPYINQRFWTLDLTTGEGRDRGLAGPGPGQINQMLWEPQTRQVLMSSYVTSSIVAYDADQPVNWPDNPRVLGSARAYEQMRPMAMVHDGRYVWMATNPQYGLLGGALCRLDPLNGELRVWRHVVVDQGINSLVVDARRRTILLGTQTPGDCDSAAPTQPAGTICLFDLDRLELRQQRPLVAGAQWNRVWAVLPTGQVLASAGNDMFLWQPEDDQLQSLGLMPAGLNTLFYTASGELWGVATEGIGRLHVGERVEFEVYNRGPAACPVLIDTTLYFARGIEIVAIPLF